MAKEIITECIINRNISLLKRVLNQDSYLGVINSLTYFLTNQIDNPKEMLKSSFRNVNNIINLFYELIHNLDGDFEHVDIIMTNTIEHINKSLCEYQSIPIDDRYHLLKHSQKRMVSFHRLVRKYIENKEKSCEFDLLCYLVDEIKNIAYFEELIKNNPSILSLEKDNVYFIEYFIDSYLQEIDKSSSEDYQESMVFFQSALRLMLENNSLKLSLSSLNWIRTKLAKVNSQSAETSFIKSNFDYYFPDDELNNASVLMESRPVVPEYKKPTQVSTRIDFRKHLTISIDPLVYKENGHSILFDDAFTLFRTSNGHMIYIHLADVPSYVFSNDKLNQELRSRLFALRDCGNYTPLFNPEFVRSYLSLAPNQERFTISIACEVNNRGKIESVDFFEGIINNKKAFTSEEVNQILTGEESDYKAILEEYAILTEAMTKRLTNPGHDIPSLLNSLAGRVVAEYFYENNLPFIYRNCVPIIDQENEEQINRLNNYLVTNICDSYLDDFVCRLSNLHRCFYDVKNKGHSELKVKAYSEISSPIRSYLAIASLQGLKEMFIKKVQTQETIEKYQREFKDLAHRANAIEKTLQLK